MRTSIAVSAYGGGVAGKSLLLRLGKIVLPRHVGDEVPVKPRAEQLAMNPDAEAEHILDQRSVVVVGVTGELGTARFKQREKLRVELRAPLIKRRTQILDRLDTQKVAEVRVAEMPMSSG
jgi:hypothetical protein